MMRLIFKNVLFASLLFCISCNSSDSEKGGDDKSGDSNFKVQLIDKNAEQKVDVIMDGKPFTSFCYSDTLMKQILYPIYTNGGNFLTRGWPIAGRPGEHTDHPHQRGMWLNYGDVNGYDFWGNSYAIKPEVRKVHDGKIVHVKIDSLVSGDESGTLVTSERWDSPYGNELLAEKTTYHFINEGDVKIIDRITTLTAVDSAVSFKDTKEGMFAIRYNRFLHLPSKKPQTFIDAMGEKTVVEADSKDATGNYLSSEGVTGESVWSTKARWMDLYGNIEGEEVSLVICDHPKNFDYPTYWHARGYGLFAANPFGAKDFTNGEKTLDFSLSKGESVTFRYRVIISSGKQLSADEINQYADSFSKLY